MQIDTLAKNIGHGIKHGCKRYTQIVYIQSVTEWLSFISKLIPECAECHFKFSIKNAFELHIFVLNVVNRVKSFSYILEKGG